MNKKLCALLLAMLVLHISKTYSQNTLSGTITNTNDKNPLEQVNVYLSQLEKGGITNKEGTYSITHLPNGTYTIIASYLGYQTYSKSITIISGNNVLDIELVPSVIEMEEVILSTPFHKLQSENVMKVETAKVSDLKTMGATTLAQGITTIAGVESVSTGMGIGKPVIRGLSGNRVLVYSQGIRIENQQFGDEHGLGINDAGIESVEVIKGPASLLYGSDAMGGVLYINPEKFSLPNSMSSDVNLDYFTNTEGVNANVGFKSSNNTLKFLIRGGITTHADYNTGNDFRVTNSRFQEYDFKTGIGYQLSNFKTELRYNYNTADLGIPEEIGEQTKKHAPNVPFQQIDNHILSSKTNLFFNNSSLEATVGYTFNTRKELEESKELAALHMELATLSYNVQYHLPTLGNWEIITAVQGLRQNNENFGEEVLIPNAITNDIGFLATSHLHIHKSDIQIGFRYDHRKIAGEASGSAAEEGYIPVINRNFESLNAAFGYKFNLTEKMIARLNIATGFRAPNLAELTSNGVHEGTSRYEIGNANLGREQNLQTDIGLEYKSEHIAFFINGFHNSVSDFIFIAPTGEIIGEDDVFLYSQQNATLFGGEMGFHLHPHPLDWLHIRSSYETVKGKLKDGQYLPMIPANNLTNTVKIEFTNRKESCIHDGYVFISLKSVFNQNNISAFESETSGYSLLNIGIGGDLEVLGQKMKVHISGANILNKSYVSHLSRLKTDGIPNIGRNINIGLSLPL
ncbi:MAG: TonB-dependent receptor [Flavobacteriaceae bacterium]|nr:MAG: TonB-dependent receptor [Flavobacteriaceae bacterium]